MHDSAKHIRIAIHTAAQHFHLNRNIQHISGTIGQQRGTQHGSSVEFQEFRGWQPGDDIRHIDWAGYARNKQLNLRMYREEISPHIDILLDGSASMNIPDGRKSLLARELAGFFLQGGQHNQGNSRLWLAAEQLLAVQQPENLVFQGQDSMLFTASPHCVTSVRSQGLCLLISDFLTRQDMMPLLRQLAARCAKLVIIMLLGPWEAAPTPENHTLIDAEKKSATGQPHSLALQLTEYHCQRYLQRVDKIRQQLEKLALQSGNLFVNVIADEDLSRVLKRDFFPLQIVQSNP